MKLLCTVVGLRTSADPARRAGRHVRPDGRSPRRAGRPGRRKNVPPEPPAPEFGNEIVTKRPRDPNAPPWQPPPAPATIPIRVAGVARDEAGRADRRSDNHALSGHRQGIEAGRHGHHRCRGPLRHPQRDAPGIELRSAATRSARRSHLTPASSSADWLPAWGSPGARSSRCTP